MKHAFYIGGGVKVIFDDKDKITLYTEDGTHYECIVLTPTMLARLIDHADRLGLTLLREELKAYTEPVCNCLLTRVVQIPTGGWLCPVHGLQY